MDVVYLDFCKALIKSLTNKSGGRIVLWASKAVFLPGWITGWQEGGRGPWSIMYLLTGPLLTVVFPDGHIRDPSIWSSTSMTWTSASPARYLSSLTTLSWGLNPIDAADPESVRALHCDIAAIGEWSTV